MDKDFLLETETARKLFHDYAEKTPILDYHCHINPREIAEDRQFDNITQVWLGDIVKPAVFINLLRIDVAVIVKNRHMLREIMIQLLCHITG